MEIYFKKKGREEKEAINLEFLYFLSWKPLDTLSSFFTRNQRTTQSQPKP